MATEQKIVEDFIAIHKIANSNEVKISYHYTVFVRTEETDNRINCFIPSFDIYFTVEENSNDAIAKKARIMAKMFIDHFFVHTKSMKNFALEVHKRGFKAPKDAYTVQQYIKNHIETTKFKFSGISPEHGYEQEMSESSEELAVA